MAWSWPSGSRRGRSCAWSRRTGLELANRELEDVELRPIRELELEDAELRLEPGDSGLELAIREPEHAELRLELEDSGLEPEDNGQCALGALHL